MYRDDSATYYYFLIINGEAHFITKRDGFSDIDDDLPLYIDELNSNHLLSPNWEAVGLCATMENRADRGEIRFYVPAEIIYDHKMMVRSKLIKMAKEKYPKTKFVYGELPNNQFQDLSYYETFSRQDDGTWGSEKVPVERAVVASENEFDVDGYDIRVLNGKPYVLINHENDFFTHYTTEKQAEKIKKTGTIPCPPEASLVCGSPLWGATPPHAEEAEVALLFRTSTKPQFGTFDGVHFGSDVLIHLLGEQPAQNAAKTAASNPLPDIGKIQKWANKNDIEVDESYDQPFVIYDESFLEKQAKLPLGKPGGPCHVLYNIENAKVPERIKEELREDIQKGRDLENSEAAMIYDNISINAGGGMVQKVELSKHAQYRMDERAISEDSLKSAFYEFDKWLQHKKRNKHQLDYKVLDKIEKLTKGGKIKFSANKIGMTLVFRMSGPSTAFLISAWWNNKPDPKAPKPGDCNYLLNKDSKMNDLEKIAIDLSNLSDNLVSFDKLACGCDGDCPCQQKEEVDHLHGDWYSQKEEKEEEHSMEEGEKEGDENEYELEVEFEKTPHGFKAEFEVEVKKMARELEGLSRALLKNADDDVEWIEEAEEEDDEEQVDARRKKHKKQKGKDYQKSKKYYRKNKQKIKRKQKKKRKSPSYRRKQKKLKKKRKNRPSGTRRSSILEEAGLDRN